jgi:hypothetical protein
MPREDETMRVLVFEGTPEEVGEAIKGLGPLAPGQAIAAVAPEAVAPTYNSSYFARVYVSTEVARRVFTRRELKPTQITVLTEIYAGGADGVLASALQSKLKYTKAQFAGLMGAFGRRVGATDGYVENTWFFDQRWDDAEACYLYKLPETVREAMRLEGLAK